MRTRFAAFSRIFLQDHSLGRAWLIRDGSRAVGYLILTFGYSLEFNGRDAFSDEFFIQASHRGRSWGRKAMHLAETSARELGVQAIHLEVTRRNTAARRLYDEIGFKQHDNHLMTKWIGDDNPESAN